MVYWMIFWNSGSEVGLTTTRLERLTRWSHLSPFLMAIASRICKEPLDYLGCYHGAKYCNMPLQKQLCRFLQSPGSNRPEMGN